MDVFTCKNCKGTSYVPPSVQLIRCRFCGTVISVGNSNDVVHHSRRPPSPLHIQCYGGELDCSIGNTSNANDVYRETKELSQEFTKKKSEAKLLCHNLRKRFPFSNVRQSQTAMPSHAISMTDQPRRGRRAFLCGVSYKNKKYELKRTAQDVRSIRDLLVQAYGFPTKSILILAEEEPYYLPTRKNIEDAFKWLIRGIQPGDSLFFYFSGHGKRHIGFDEDEIDGFDEIICPMDYEINGMIWDNDINKAIVRPLIQHVTLHAIIDSCQSALDLPRVYNNTTGGWDDIAPPSGAYKGTNGGRAICFSTCQDYQLAADTSIFSTKKEMPGAMTISFIHAIKAALAKKEEITYQGIMDSIHQSMKQAGKSRGLFAGIFHHTISQDPILSSSEEFDTNTEFRL